MDTPAVYTTANPIWKPSGQIRQIIRYGWLTTLLPRPIQGRTLCGSMPAPDGSTVLTEMLTWMCTISKLTIHFDDRIFRAVIPR